MLCTWMWDLSFEFTINKTKNIFILFLLNVDWCAKKGSGYFLNHAYGDDYFSTVLIMRIVTVFLELGSLFVFHWQYRFLSPHSSISCFSPHSSPTVLFPFAIAWLCYSSPLSLLKYCFSHLFHFSFSLLFLSLPLLCHCFLGLIMLICWLGKKKSWQTPKNNPIFFASRQTLKCVCAYVHMSCKRWLTLEKAKFLTPFQPPHCALLEG